MKKTIDSYSETGRVISDVSKDGISSTATTFNIQHSQKEGSKMTETIESKKAPVRFDPFTNPGPLAEEEATWLNHEFPGLNITPGQVRAVISNHARFQKSDSRVQNRTSEVQERINEREARQARYQERMRLAAEKREARQQAAAEREAAKAVAAAEKAAKAAEKAAAAKASSDGDLADAIAAANPPKKVRKPRPTAKVSAEAQDTF